MFLLVHPRQPMGNQRDSAPLAHPVRSECVFFGLNRATVYHRAEHIANTLGRLKSHSDVPGRRRPFGPHERKGGIRATPQKVVCICMASPFEAHRPFRPRTFTARDFRANPRLSQRRPRINGQTIEVPRIGTGAVQNRTRQLKRCKGSLFQARARPLYACRDLLTIAQQCSEPIV